ncbi:polynucleotidyl transferase, ribonuclease H-like superfamily protein [Artemisia annua]|uniref:Polynucleotidyl transferase, ribonuclease H-like superfamily protein n=1 Tax=Artemisia annua TaxID=35608 RepID=A0A2U1LGC5_ARTAN|nr:polynucleotidyl transferase, ribonuclease H-like superfamily protein [Artemisia annua]
MSSEIVFFDLETNVPRKPGQKFWVLEFGAMVVCPRKLVEIESYCTLIRPGDLSVVGVKPARDHGISRGTVLEAPSFEEVADKIFKILNGRIWAGHNIQRFDCVRIRAAFEEIGRPAPEPVALIDSLWVLSEKFGKRAGNMKMASLASYFGLGDQKHRSLDDVRMNLEVLKHCATVLFLESSVSSTMNKQWPQEESRVSNTMSKRWPQEESRVSSTRNKQWHQEESRVSSTTNKQWPQEESRISSSRNKRWPQEATPTMTTRSRSKPYGDETSRKSPSAVLNHRRVVPYPTRSLGQMTEKVKNILCNARTTSLNNLLKHSHTLLS